MPDNVQTDRKQDHQERAQDLVKSEVEEAMVNLAGYSSHMLPYYYRDQRAGLTSYLFRLQTEGQAQAIVNGRLTEIRPGDLLLYAPGDPYELVIEREDLDTPAKEPISGDYYVSCQGPWLDWWWRSRSRPTKVNIPLDDRLIVIWKQIATEQFRTDQYVVGISSQLLKALCLMVDRILSGLNSHRVPLQGFIAYRMRNYIEENASRQFSLEEVAKYVGLSVSRAVHLFKESFGLSIMQYALEVRLKMASHRIAFDNATLEDIAEGCGFGSYSYFHRVFRARFGKSPKEYRFENR